MKRSVVLDAAADLIEKNGWTQREMGYEQVGFCAVGAIRKAVTGSSALPFGMATGDVERAIAALPIRGTLRHPHIREWNVTEWNDMNGRTQEEVVLVLRKTAKKLRRTFR